MAKTLSAAEVAQHNTKESCWVVLYGHVYDVTSFLSSHPGGAKIILSLAGTDATEEYDPVHPAGVLETDLPPEAKLGRFNNGSSDTTLASAGQREPDVDSKPARGGQMEPKPLEALLNIDDLEEQATRLLSEKAHAYYYSAADELLSKTLNNTVFRDILLRPRVFVDCTTCDLSTSILGHRLGLPVYVSPAAMARLGHSDGELGIAQAASRFGAMQIVSNSASMTPEQIVADTTPGQIFGWQLYVQSDRSKSEAMLQRINKLREWYKFVCLTVDAPIAGKRELDERSNMAKGLLRVQSGSNEKSADEQRPGGGGVGQQLFFGTATDLTWETTLTWLSRHTDLPIVLKGIQTHEDALLAAQSPHVKAIILSNHGGRSVDTAPPAVHTLLEIRKYCPEVFSRVEVWIDGGIRRGTDVVKALCLGAKVVGVGRAPLWGLGAGGRAGVERMFEILEQEISTCMRLLGVKNMTELGPRFINARKVEQYIYGGNASLDKERAKSRAKL